MGLKELLEHLLRGEGPAPPIMEALGLSLTKCEGGWARVEMVADERFHNLMGIVHGAIATGLADTAMGLAVTSLLEDDESCTTVELKINFVRPVISEKLIADGKVLHRGGRTALAEATVTNEEGKLVAKATSTCLILKDEA